MYTYKISLVRVIDGDTIVVNIDLGFKVVLHKQYIRLHGIDTPERGQDGFLQAKQALETKLGDVPLGKLILQSHKDTAGKFGRWLGVLLIDEGNGIVENVNQWMIEKHYARFYIP